MNATKENWYKAKHSTFSRYILCMNFITTIVLSLFLRISYNQMTQLNKFHQNLTSMETAVNGQANVSLPKVIWLMSFPNSGSSFTTKMVRTLTNSPTATTYGEEHVDALSGFSIPLARGVEYQNGPFLSYTHNLNVPQQYVLTKTHCGGRCSRCKPINYVESNKSFKQACLTARRGIPLNETYEKNQYEESLVQKAIHIIRNPLDNIVSRFHLVKKLSKKKDETFNFTDDADGFQNWCYEWDQTFNKEEEEQIDEIFLQDLPEIPCHADFYRYVQWHNLAFDIIEEMSLPLHILYFEDFEEDFNRTKDEILQFMEAKEVSIESKRRPMFIPGKKYEHFYTPKQIKAIRKFVFEHGSQQTQYVMKKYF